MLDRPAAPPLHLPGLTYDVFLAQLHEHLQPSSYLEIGTCHGTSLAAARCDTVAVDPMFQLGVEASGRRARTFLFQMTSDAFFRSTDVKALLGRPVDLAFLDGMHRFEYLLRDFINTEAACHRRSMILMHDCLPANVRMTNRLEMLGEPSEQFHGWWTGDVWKMLPILRQFRPDLRLHVFDCPPTGLVAVSRLNPEFGLLRDRYHDIVDQYANVSLDDDGLRKLRDKKTLCDTQWLCAQPDRLTALFSVW